MNKAEFEKKLLQEKIAAHRRILELETKQVKQALHPRNAIARAGKSIAPKLAAAAPSIAAFFRAANPTTRTLMIVAGVTALIPFAARLFSHSEADKAD